MTGGGAAASGIFDPETASRLPDPHRAIEVFREMNEGKALTETGQPGLAAAVLENARTRDPTNPYVSMYLALAYRQLGDTAALGRTVDHLLRIAPEHLPGHLLLAELRLLLGDLEGSLAALERAVELDPRNQSTRLHLAHRLEDAGRDPEAGRVYRELLEAAPDQTLARNGYATLLYRRGQTAEAIAELERVRLAQPFYVPAHLNLAVIRHDQGRTEESLRLVERALELRPGYGPAHELRALGLEVLGREEEARSAWGRALRFAASPQARERARAALDR